MSSDYEYSDDDGDYYDDEEDMMDTQEDGECLALSPALDDSF
jgi:ariadne-1